jgi:carbon storage regulator CsrA
MLVLNRKINQRIRIGEDIVVCVVGIDPGGFVKLGIDAPLDVRVDREEIARMRRNVSLISLRNLYYQGVVDHAGGLTFKPQDPSAYKLAFTGYQ